jgi:hypothetical protein
MYYLFYNVKLYFDLLIIWTFSLWSISSNLSNILWHNVTLEGLDIHYHNSSCRHSAILVIMSLDLQNCHYSILTNNFWPFSFDLIEWYFKYQQTDSDTYIHTDSDTYIHTDSDTYIHTDSDTYIHTDSDTYIHTDSDTYIHTDSDTYIHTDSDTHIHTDSDTYIHTDSDTYIHTDSDTYIHTDFDTYIHTDSDTYIHTDSDTYIHTDSDTYIHTDSDTYILSLIYFVRVDFSELYHIEGYVYTIIDLLC